MGDFYIVEHGAVADGTTLNTLAIQRAIDACHAAGGGRVVCPAGTFRTGSIALKSGVELHLEAGCKLLGSTRQADYADFRPAGFAGHFHFDGNDRTIALVSAAHADHIAITGAGEINGDGPKFFDTVTTERLWSLFYPKPPHDRPFALALFCCRDVRVEGIGLIDSPYWSFWLGGCERVRVYGIRIIGDQRMINNDGLDIDCCRDVTVSDCDFRTGDDCIAIRAMVQQYDREMPCENIVVRDCRMDSYCQGVRFGVATDGVIRHCRFSNLTIRSEAHGVTAEMRGGGPGLGLDMSDVHFANVTIECAGWPIKVLIEDDARVARVSDLSFTDFRVRGGRCVIKGSPQMTVRNVRVENLVSHSTGEAIQCRWCEGVRLNNVELASQPS